MALLKAVVCSFALEPFFCRAEPEAHEPSIELLDDSKSVNVLLNHNDRQDLSMMTVIECAYVETDLLSLNGKRPVIKENARHLVAAHCFDHQPFLINIISSVGGGCTCDCV